MRQMDNRFPEARFRVKMGGPYLSYQTSIAEIPSKIFPCSRKLNLIHPFVQSLICHTKNELNSMDLPVRRRQGSDKHNPKKFV